MIPIADRKQIRRLGFVVVAVLSVIALVENLAPRNIPDTSPRTGPDPYWGKHWMGNVTVHYPNLMAHFMDIFYRLRFSRTGMVLTPGSKLSLDLVIDRYYTEMIPRPNSFTIYYSSGLDGAATTITPITKTNAGRVFSIPAPLETLLASNGFTVVRISRNAIKVFPTSMAATYSNAPIAELSRNP